MTRSELAAELLRDCPEESRTEHEVIARAILAGADRESVLNMTEANNWPETYAWLAAELPSAGTVRLHIPDLPEPLHRKIKTAAAGEGKTLKTWVIEAMNEKLATKI